MSENKFVAAIDQGTTSTRCIIFNHDGEQVAVGQFEHEQIFPEKGWVEHDPKEIWDNTRRAVGEALANGDVAVESIVALGITNQRETTVVWDKYTGEPVYNAIVWQDTRTTQICKELAGGKARISGVAAPAWSSTPTRQAQRSNGSSITSRVRASAPRLVTCSSAPSIPGCCGTSPAVLRAMAMSQLCTQPTSLMRPVPS